jgi:hypothetical protein
VSGIDAFISLRIFPQWQYFARSAALGADFDQKLAVMAAVSRLTRPTESNIPSTAIPALPHRLRDGRPVEYPRGATTSFK